MTLYWLSFVNPDLAPPEDEQRPGGQSFLGVCIVEATDPLNAIPTAWRVGCNPGGAVQIMELPDAAWEFILPEDMNRLLTMDEALALDDRAAPPRGES